MRQSEFFIPLRREDPRDEEFKNAKLLLRAGFIDKLSSGVFTILPLGLRVFEKIKNIIRDELNPLGALELSMPSLQTPRLWQETGRWESFRPEMFQFKDRSGKPLGLAATHEEVVFDIARRNVKSSRELPLSLYQFQTKFRDEPRPKSGLIRGREFLMKDLYSFHASRQDLEDYYEKIKQAYLRVFKSCGIDPVVVEASGGVFTKNYSHEFQVLAESGEDTVIICEKCGFARNKEIAEGLSKCPSCGNKTQEKKSVEVGNTFRFYDKYANDMRGFVQNEKGEKLPILLASYGIGISRLMATIAEIHNDEAGLLWPENVAPFKIHLLALGNDDKTFELAEKLFVSLQKDGYEVLYDDRKNVSAGEKLVTSDLLGMPWRVIVGRKTVEAGKLEARKRSGGKTILVSESEFKKLLK